MTDIIEKQLEPGRSFEYVKLSYDRDLRLLTATNKSNHNVTYYDVPIVVFHRLNERTFIDGYFTDVIDAYFYHKPDDKPLCKPKHLNPATLLLSVDSQGEYSVRSERISNPFDNPMGAPDCFFMQEPIDSVDVEQFNPTGYNYIEVEALTSNQLASLLTTITEALGAEHFKNESLFLKTLEDCLVATLGNNTKHAYIFTYPLNNGTIGVSCSNQIDPKGTCYDYFVFKELVDLCFKQEMCA